jgi:hypothetical protein
MRLPPSDAGTFHVTVAFSSPAVAETPEGASGTVVLTAGVTDPLAGDSALSPIPFVARTVKVYEVPLASLVTVTFVVLPESTSTVAPPGEAVTL